jgi:hypothetical protein
MSEKIGHKDDLMLRFFKNELSEEDLLELLEYLNENQINAIDFKQLYEIWLQFVINSDVASKYDSHQGFLKFKKRIQS